MNADYLHTCRALPARVARIRCGQAQNLERLEDAVAGIRSSRQLTCGDIEGIRDSEARDADAFGYWPPRSEIDMDPGVDGAGFQESAQEGERGHPEPVREIHRDARRSTEIIACCKKARKTRNRAVHPDPPPAKEKVEQPLKTMKEVVRMERARCRRAKSADAEPSNGGADEFSAMHESFREERTLAELAVEQGGMTPQPMEEMIGAFPGM